MDLYLSGKKVLITGASAGIGFATASLFAEEGCDLVLVARTQSTLEEAAETLRLRFPITVQTLSVDAASRAGIQAISGACGSIDILVNNAGAVPPGSLSSVGEEEWRAAWDLKVFGYINLTRALYPVLKEQSGVVINVIGSSGERAEPNYIAGSAGNAALMAFTRALGSAAPRDGMRVAGVNPGAVATERIQLLLQSRAERQYGDASRWREFYETLAFGRAATPEEIANAVVFLASPRSGYTSGTILTIDDPARPSL